MYRLSLKSLTQPESIHFLVTLLSVEERVQIEPFCAPNFNSSPNAGHKITVASAGSQLYQKLIGQLNNGFDIEMIDRFMEQILFLHALIQKRLTK